MNTKLVVIGIGGLLAAGLLIWYFSPYQQCVRAQRAYLYNFWASYTDTPSDELRIQADQRAKLKCQTG